MSEQQGYNGWRNYPTWNVALWLDNDPGTYEEVRRSVREAVTDGDQMHPRYEAKEAVKAYVEELVDQEMTGLLDSASFVSDIFGWAIEQVDWYELADNYLQEVSEDA